VLLCADLRPFLDAVPDSFSFSSLRCIFPLSYPFLLACLFRVRIVVPKLALSHAALSVQCSAQRHTLIYRALFLSVKKQRPMDLKLIFRLGAQNAPTLQPKVVSPKSLFSPLPPRHYYSHSL
jgi:hypothetical protein